MASETSEQRVKAAVPNAYAAFNSTATKERWTIRLAGIASDRVPWRPLCVPQDTEESAWDAAVTCPEVVAFESTLRVQDAPSRDWTEDSPHENGNYVCRCVTCKQNFIGHKRRVQCKLCAVQDAPEVVRENAEGKPSDEDVNEPPICARCNSEYRLTDFDYEPTKYCDNCAHIRIAELEAAAKPRSPDSPDRKLNQYGLTPEEWNAVVNIGCSLHEKLLSEPEGEYWYDGQSLSIMEHLVQAWNAALRTRPKGEAKVTWRVDGGWVSRGDDVFHQYYRANEESAKIYAASWVDAAMPGTPSERWANVVKIDTYETVVETRKKEA